MRGDVVVIDRDGTGKQWRICYEWFDVNRYSYYPIDKFKDELDAYKWFTEQMKTGGANQ